MTSMALLGGQMGSETLCMFAGCFGLSGSKLTKQKQLYQQQCFTLFCHFR